MAHFATLDHFSLNFSRYQFHFIQNSQHSSPPPKGTIKLNTFVIVTAINQATITTEQTTIHCTVKLHSTLQSPPPIAYYIYILSSVTAFSQSNANDCSCTPLCCSAAGFVVKPRDQTVCLLCLYSTTNPDQRQKDEKLADVLLLQRSELAPDKINPIKNVQHALGLGED